MAGMATQAATSWEQRRRKRLKALRLTMETEGARLQFWARSAALAVIGVVFTALTEWNAALAYTLSGLVLFLLTGLLNYWLAKTGRRPTWVSMVLATLDLVLLTYLIIAPNPFATSSTPIAMGLREAGFKYLLIIICLGALTLSPRLAIWLGATAAVCWTVGVAAVVVQPGTIIAHGSPNSYSLAERMALYFDPHFVDLVEQVTNVVVILIISGIIATVAMRASKLADDYAKSERARSNLARHFSPNVVDELASNDEPFGPIRRQDIAVIFADIIGFTAYTEEHPAEQVFQLLREFHRRMEAVVFEHQGTVDNYIGDCIMATFGVPDPGLTTPRGRCGATRAMIEALDGWNRERARPASSRSTSASAASSARWCSARSAASATSPSPRSAIPATWRAACRILPRPRRRHLRGCGRHRGGDRLRRSRGGEWIRQPRRRRRARPRGAGRRLVPARCKAGGVRAGACADGRGALCPGRAGAMHLSQIANDTREGQSVKSTSRVYVN